MPGMVIGGKKMTELFSADWLSSPRLLLCNNGQPSRCAAADWHGAERWGLEGRTDAECETPNAKLLILRDPVKCVGQRWMTTAWLAGSPNSLKPCLAYVLLCVFLCAVVSPLLISSCHTRAVNTHKSPHRTRVLVHSATSASSSDAAEQCPSLPTESAKL